MIKALVLYAQFFTRIPLPFAIDDPGTKFKQNIQFFSLFGLILGCLEGLIFWGWLQVFPTWFAWILFIIGDGIITGGFHLDAFADTADGLFSARTVDKMLTIMKDSRLGTMGSLALIYFYAIIGGAGIVLADANFDDLFFVRLAIIMIMITKTSACLQFYKMKYAGKGGGLASIWQGISTWRIVLDQIFAAIVIFLLLGYVGLISYVAVVIVAIGYRWGIYKLFNGMTGDTVGSFAEIGQIVFLLVFTAIKINF
ncbi:adenosylcobinamide-GDP ribazoletransferase [Lentilactobacillus sp. Marseille-Q4993]|uniref:adenosylcobinamide-GDP ribazoletransferase n=1 Tax=Lentilactobacillus sp. Marseille-Q4993 TaxID=3039492 RepID=UPI0024BCDB36|nr:adenosylcobinamide-GDP ribazoletransferase [Lentilactobacillus sp. Marseille-Q4993]